jgi:signal transduction histidine kinase/DNA-binding response OmpR family regulator
MILIVDDKPENIFSLKSILELNNFEVDTAYSGEEALKKLLKQTYALIILDVQMPDMDGFEVAETLAGYTKTRETPIIFLSAVNTDKKFITKGYSSGAVDYITKPVDPDILILKVRTFLKLYQQTHELNEMQKSLLQEIEIRKLAEENLHQTVDELHSVMESLPQIAFTAKADGKIDFVNEHWFEYSESKEVFPGSHPDYDNLSKKWKSVVTTSKPFQMEVCIKKLSTGEFKYHLMKVHPFFVNGALSKWVGTLTDIHEQKMFSNQLEQKVEERTKELKEINLQLETSNHDLQQFASVASHDLSEPLRKIQTFGQMIKEFFPQEESQAVLYLNKMIISAERMSKLINDLLNYSRLSTADLFEHADLNVIISNILVDLELPIQEKQAVVHVDPIPVLEIIPGLIRQVFQNIISNSLKFAKPDTPAEIFIRSEIIKIPDVTGTSEDEIEYCKISIRDNGIGFNEAYADKIFALFQRLNSRDKYEGTGIGLAIAKKAIEKHHGSIMASGKPGEGAEFIIHLPIKQTKHKKDMVSSAIALSN